MNLTTKLRFFKVAQSEKVIFPGWNGELGWMILTYVRHVYSCKAKEKIVCIEKGLDPLFPGCQFHYITPPPDKDRSGNGNFYWQLNYKKVYPDFALDPLRYNHNLIDVKVPLTVTNCLPKVDIAIGIRKREMAAERNWQYFDWLINSLRTLGYTVGLCGKGDIELEGDVEACRHPDGAMAGSIDIIQNAKIYFGIDSGISHLAALIGIPMIVITKVGTGDLRYLMKKANKNTIIPGYEIWDKPNYVLEEIIQLKNKQEIASHQ